MIIENSCNYFLQKFTDGLFSNNFSIHRIHEVKKIYKFIKFIADIHNLLKFFFLLLPSEKTNLSIKGLRIVHIVSQQCYRNPFVWAIRNINHLVNNLPIPWLPRAWLRTFWFHFGNVCFNRYFFENFQN